MLLLFLLPSVCLPAALPRSDGSFPGKGSYNAWINANQFIKFGNDFADKGDLNHALECYKNAINTYPYDSIFYFNVGNAFSRQGKLAIAEESYRKAIDLEPDYFQAWLNLGHTIAKLGRPLEAARTLKQAARFSQNPEEKDAIERTVSQLEKLPTLESPPTPDDIKKKNSKKKKRRKKFDQIFQSGPPAE